MIRKLIKQGHNTLTVTLPSKWIKKFNLKPGEEINLLERDNGIILSSEKIDDPSEIEINIEGLDIHLIWKHINTAYREGYEKIIIKFNPNTRYNSPYRYFAHFIDDARFATGKENLTPRDFIQQITTRYIGLEVIDHGKDYCVLKEIGQSTSKEFDSSLRRIFLVLLDMSEGIIADIQNNSHDFLDRTHNADLQVDRFHDFCARVLNKSGLEDSSKSSLTFMLIYLLELVGDEFKHLAIQLMKKDSKKLDSKKTVILLTHINNQLKVFYELYYKYDRAKMIKLSEMNKMLLDKEHSKKENGYKEDVQVTIETINRYIDVLSELLIAKQIAR